MSKTIIVTGASRGIGYETSLSLADGGHQVIAVARSKEPLEILKKKYPKNIESYSADLTLQDNISELTEFIKRRNSKIDVLINNAGKLINKSFEELTESDWQQLLEVNFLSAVNLIRSLLPQFNTKSHIVNISSMGGFQGSVKFPGLSAYSVAKGALSILSECLAVELSDRNIHTNALCLGAVQTEMLEQAFPGFEAPVNAKEMGKYIATFALEGSNFYNGQILPVTLGNPD